MTSNNNAIIDQIVEEEWEMFAALIPDGPAACQHRYKTFHLMRWMTHSIHSRAFLKSYLADLTHAKSGGRNLMTEKYARMENQIPPLKNHRMRALIREAAEMEKEWMKELRKYYPMILTQHTAKFLNYAASEMETWSLQTIILYYDELIDARTKGYNPVKNRYENLAQRLGYESLEQMHQTFVKRQQGLK